jgi:hypothetical protein
VNLYQRGKAEIAKPMHKHRARSNGVSIKMRLAASKNIRTRHKDGMEVTLPKTPWGKKDV